MTDADLLGPFHYLQQQPGKEIRGQLVESFDVWLNVPPQRLAIIKSTIEMLHNASLLVDDVEDDSVLRRGRPVAHKIYGVASTINCANMVYFMALREVQRLPLVNEAVRIFTGPHYDII
jgi:geranylgeranyl diphosphate synthase type 3